MKERDDVFNMICLRGFAEHRFQSFTYPTDLVSKRLVELGFKDPFFVLHLSLLFFKLGLRNPNCQL